MAKAKKEKSPDLANWVPGWFGSTLTVRPSPKHVQKQLKDRISKAARAKAATVQPPFDNAEDKRRFGI
jgi:acetylornithine deacetylase/succinyl-diaminopimelate desuccinylase-like protein